MIPLQTTVLVLIFAISVQELIASGVTDSASIRAIESELRRVKVTSESIVTELKKQKDSTTSLQNEFKWLHNELKAIKKSLADIEMVVNKTAGTDMQFLREKFEELTQFLKDANKNKSLDNESTTKTTTSKKFKLF